MSIYTTDTADDIRRRSPLARIAREWEREDDTEPPWERADRADHERDRLRDEEALAADYDDRHREDCPECIGTGIGWPADTRCTRCRGRGWVWVNWEEER